MSGRAYAFLLLALLLAGMGLTRWIVAAQAQADYAAGQATVASLQGRMADLEQAAEAREAERVRLLTELRDLRAQSTPWLDAQTTRLLDALRREWGACIPGSRQINDVHD